MIFEDDIYGDPATQYLESFRTPKTNRFTSGPTVLAYTFLAATVGYHMLQYFDYPVLPISELAWNILVYLTPSRAISMLDTRVNGLSLGGPPADDETSTSRHLALKSEALRRIIGLDRGGILDKIHQAQNLPGLGRLLPGRKRNMDNGIPPGLGNWDNSCYQNSVIQGLASLQYLPSYLAKSIPLKGSISTATALRTIIATLNDHSNVGLMFWIPVELKTMNSWQQQDAQEYFSKVLDEVGKEVMAGQIATRNLAAGLASFSQRHESTCRPDHNSETKNTKSMNINTSRSIRGIDQIPADEQSTLARSPLEGLLAQRVGCLKCGYVEGLSLIPFNCLTVPLGSEWMYDIRSCLDDYTALEPIGGVECVKCTLLRNKLQLERLFTQTQDSAQDLNGTPLLTQALHASIRDRLSAVEKALDENDFSDNAILKKCEIPANQRVSATKSRQAVVARAPKSLVIHVNRSVFDEATGMQCKNFADVKYPLELDLAPWCLGTQSPRKDEVETVEKWSVDPSKSMHSIEAEDMATSEFDSATPSSQLRYKLRAVITHYGRHENGHYICYRKLRTAEHSAKSVSENSESWWCFNDEEVSKVSENTVLEQGGVFMLFYEKVEMAKDEILGSPKCHDPALLDSSPRPVESTSKRQGIDVNDCVPSETISINSVTNLKKTPIGIMHNIHSETLSTTHSAGNQTLDNPEPSIVAEDANNTARTPSQILSASPTPSSTFREARDALISDESTQARPAMPGNNLLAPTPENPSSSEPAPAKFFQTRSLPQNRLPIESYTTDDAKNTESFDVTISTTNENTQSLPPEPGTVKLDDVPDKSPKPNHHHPMRTASPRSSRGSVSRAGKAMSNVSTMVIAN